MNKVALGKGVALYSSASGAIAYGGGGKAVASHQSTYGMLSSFFLYIYMNVLIDIGYRISSTEIK